MVLSRKIHILQDLSKLVTFLLIIKIIVGSFFQMEQLVFFKIL